MEYKGDKCSNTPVSSLNFFMEKESPWALKAKNNLEGGWPYIAFCVKCLGTAYGGLSAETPELKIR